MSVLILYAYCEYQEGKSRNLLSKNNLIYFLENGLIDNLNYTFYINISGKYSINFKNYLNKYKNLFITNINGINAYQSWYNILKKINPNEYDYFLFLKDKIRGPYYFKLNWLEYMIKNIGDNCLISSYGTSPFGKLSKIPYIPDKFFMINKNTINIIFENNFLKKNFYDVDLNSVPKYHTYDTLVEIKLSKLLLDNNINYVALDKNGILDLNILKYYKEKNWDKLFEITKELHKVNDTTIHNRIFWSGKTMKKIFEDKDKLFIKNLKKERDICNLKKW